MVQVPPPGKLPEVIRPTWGRDEAFTAEDEAAWSRDIKATWLGSVLHELVGAAGLSDSGSPHPCAQARLLPRGMARSRRRTPRHPRSTCSVRPSLEQPLLTLSMGRTCPCHPSSIPSERYARSGRSSHQSQPLRSPRRRDAQAHLQDSTARERSFLCSTQKRAVVPIDNWYSIRGRDRTRVVG